MPEVDRDQCRKAAAACIELARVTTDVDKKQMLLTHAQEWLKLAYSQHEAKFEQLLVDFNRHQMDLGGTRRPAPYRRMQRQPLQQQQKKAEGR
jgi:hypothetical protein